jgi:hypothetical protein
MECGGRGGRPRVLVGRLTAESSFFVLCAREFRFPAAISMRPGRAAGHGRRRLPARHHGIAGAPDALHAHRVDRLPGGPERSPEIEAEGNEHGLNEQVRERSIHDAAAVWNDMVRDRASP